MACVAKGQVGISVVCKLGPKPYLVNTHKEQQKELLRGSVVVGFGKGKFKLNEQPEPIVQDGVPRFLLEGSSDMILHNNELTTVKDVMDAKRKTDPLAKVAYHKLVETNGEDHELGAFSLTQEHDVYFHPVGHALDADGDAQDSRKPNQNFAACLIPHKLWETYTTAVEWAAKWAVNGLTPMRPVVVMTRDVELAPGRALELF